MLLNCGVGEDSWEFLGLQGDLTNPSLRKSVLNIQQKDWCWSWNSSEAETPILWPPDAKNWLIGKNLDARKDWRQEEKGMTEDEMVGWHHHLDWHELEQVPGAGDGQGCLACFSPWGPKEFDMTKQLNWIELILLEDMFLLNKNLPANLAILKLVYCKSGSGKIFQLLVLILLP